MPGAQDPPEPAHAEPEPEREREREAPRAEEPVEALYAALRELARAALGGRRAAPALDPTELVHEAFLRLSRVESYRRMPRREFLALSATVLRRLLVDEARRQQAERRGGSWRRVTFSELSAVPDGDPVDVLDLDGALARLAQLDERQARVVELRFFGGLTQQEIADLLGLSRQHVQREWAMGRAWLRRELDR